MRIKIPSIQELWRRTDRNEKILLLVMAVFVVIFTSGTAIFAGTIWLIYSVGTLLFSILNSNAGFIIAPYIPSLIDRFSKKNTVQVGGPAKFVVPKRVDTSESAREIVLNHAMEYLNALTGLNSVKDQIKKYKAMMIVAEKRRVFNKTANRRDAVSLNLVFLGSSGTGKTTVARVWGDVLFGLGFLESGHIVEVDRSNLVGKFIGHTAQLTLEACQAALDGVLFIDEAYALSKPNAENDFGREAIETLMKFMEDYRGRISIIAAGYGREMELFLDSNPGLKSRFPRKIEFNDYSAEELYEIFQKCADSDQMSIPSRGRDFLLSLFKKIRESRADFGNARFVRNFYSSCKENHAIRLAESNNYSDTELNFFNLSDFEDSIKENS